MGYYNERRRNEEIVDAKGNESGTEKREEAALRQQHATKMLCYMSVAILLANSLVANLEIFS